MENSVSHRKRKGVDVSQGPPQKRNGDVMQIHGVINTPPIPGENAPSSSRQGTHVVCPLDFCFANLFFLAFPKLHVEI